MLKKIISCAMVLALVITTVFVLPITTQAVDDTFTKGSVSEKNWEKQGNSSTVTITTNSSDYYYEGDSDITSQVKVAYTGLTSSVGPASFMYNSYIAVPYGNKSVISFWVYSTQAIKINMLFTDVPTNGTAKDNGVLSDTLTLDIPMGGKLVEVNITDFQNPSKTYSYERMYQVQFRPFAASGSASTEGALYIDNFGFCKKPAVAGDLNDNDEVDCADLFKLQKMAVNGNTSAVDTTPYNLFKDSFINYRDVKLMRSYMLGLNTEITEKPITRTDNTYMPIDAWKESCWSTSGTNIADFVLQEQSDYYFAGDNNESALKVNYSEIQTKSDNRIVFKDRVIPAYASQSVISVYVYADQPLKLTVLWNWAKEGNSNYLSSNKTVSLSQGDNLVYLPMNQQIHDDRTDIPVNYEFYNLQLRFQKVDDNTLDNGTVYVDSLGIIDIDANRDSSFYELDYTTATNWSVNKGSNVSTAPTKSVDTNASAYYGTYGDKTAVKMMYAGITTDESTGFANIYYTPSVTPEYAANSIISAVVYADQPMKLKIFWAWGSDSGNSSVKYIDLDTGENIINIPMSDYNYAGRPAGTDFAFNTLQFRFYRNASSTTDSGTVYIDSLGICEKVNVELMLDGNTETYWSVGSAKTSTVDFSLAEETNFNSINLIEHGSFITDYVVSAKLSGMDTYTEIYHQDEMGTRQAILDDTYTAKDFRLTATASSGEGGISELSFDEKMTVSDTETFKNISFYTPQRVEFMQLTDYSELIGLTDIILFGFGSWDKNGNFNWDETYGKSSFETELTKIREKLGTLQQTTNIWFSLGNYKDSTISSTSSLLATQDARNRLTNFAHDLCSEYELYGIDIDYEYPSGNTAWNNFNALLSNLGNSLHAGNYKLSCDLLDNHCQYIGEAAMKAIDMVNVMAYDREGIDAEGRHSTYATAKYAIDYFSDLGFEKSKLVLGLPFYGKTTFGEGTDPKYSTIVSLSDVSISKSTNLYTHTDGKTYYFNGVNMIRDKVYYAMSNGCAGVFNWCMGCDVAGTSELSLSATVNNTINKFKSAN